MKLTCFIPLLFPAFGALAQKIESYYDMTWKPTDAAHARFYSMLEHTDSGWRRLDYFLNGATSVQMVGLYEDSACNVANGSFIYVFPNKIPESKGRYVHSKKEGLWLSFYPNGIMRDSTTYNGGNPIGICKSWHSNGYTSDSAIYNPDGSGVHVSWFDNGSPSSAGLLAAGYKQRGRWQYFHKNGRVSAIELFDNGTLTARQYFDENGQLLPDTANKDRNAEFRGGINAWLKYLDKHLDFPSGYNLTNSDETAVVVTMTVDEDGKVTDAYISTPFYPPFEKTALYTILHSPAWTPAIDHNRKMKAVFRQPVVFRQVED
jgi:antitoxin component YwqK of YwqJK toxin-antitoxin module